MIHIFLSYRRADTADATGRLYDNLLVTFGEELVFRDVYSLVAGIDWREHISQTLKESDVVLAVIGPTWLTATDAKGRRRIDDPEDTVRKELERAMELKVPIIPVLVGSATMPRPEDLPEPLKSLYYLNAAPLRDTDFKYDYERLVKAIRKYARQTDPENLERSKSADERKPSGDVVAATGDGGQAILKPSSNPSTARWRDILKCVFILAIFFIAMAFTAWVTTTSDLDHQVWRVILALFVVVAVLFFAPLLTRAGKILLVGGAIVIFVAVYAFDPVRYLDRRSEKSDPPGRGDTSPATMKFQVVMGDYPDMNEARQKEKMAIKLGYSDAEVFGASPHFHVRVPFPEKEDAVAAAEKLRDAGVAPAPDVAPYHPNR